MAYDKLFRTEANYLTSGKWPHILFADQERAWGIGNQGYLNNSLEGTLFDQNPITDGIITIPGAGPATVDWYFYEHLTDPLDLSSATISSGECTVVTSTDHGYAIGDIVSITGVFWDTTHPFINGTWKIKDVPTTSSFVFEINAPNASSFTLDTPQVQKSSVFEIRDNRLTTDAKGQSFTSVLFTVKQILEAGVGYKRILPSDLYTRFRFQSGSDITPQGGINTNLFNVVDSADNNIKPALWAYFFGYNSTTTPTDAFEIAFNSYAVVLRPSGEGSRLEFALLKFNWGEISNWQTDIIDTGSEKYKNWSDLDLGYLIATNPEVGKVAGTAVVNELATSDSFTYNSEFAAKFNLKITVRKHLLSDSELDGTYLVNLMINDDYDSFGEGTHYDSILHAYIQKPSPTSNTLTGSDPHDYMLMPMLYFKFNNINKENVNVFDADLNQPGSSRIIQDSLMFRQLNALDETSYLY
jgi:hypothetical protein